MRKGIVSNFPKVLPLAVFLVFQACHNKPMDDNNDVSEIVALVLKDFENEEKDMFPLLPPPDNALDTLPSTLNKENEKRKAAHIRSLEEGSYVVLLQPFFYGLKEEGGTARQLEGNMKNAFQALVDSLYQTDGEKAIGIDPVPSTTPLFRVLLPKNMAELDSLFEPIRTGGISDGKILGVVGISQIVFDANKEKAVLSASFVRGKLNGHGFLLLFAKESGAWKIIQRVSTWVS
jgi:hypothetical protein